MERLLVLRLEASGCIAAAELNGMPVAMAGSLAGASCVPVHEYTMSGTNRLSLAISSPAASTAPSSDAPSAAARPVPAVADGHRWARLRLLLPRQGQPAHEDSARTLAQLDWMPTAGTRYETPLTLDRQVELPIAFPRWRWLDAPVVADVPALADRMLEFVQRLALDLQQGDAESLIGASRLRLEELAAAYQRPVADEVVRLRAQVQRLFAAGQLAPPMPTAATLRLRRVAGGRLVELLDPSGGPVLRSGPLAAPVDASSAPVTSWPLRVAVVEGKLYVLR